MSTSKLEQLLQFLEKSPEDSFIRFAIAKEYEKKDQLDKALDDLKWAGSLYEGYPQVLGAAIWYLGAGYSNICDKAQKLIAPVTKLALNWESEKPEPPDPPEPHEPPSTVQPPIPPVAPEEGPWRITLEHPETGRKLVFEGNLTAGQELFDEGGGSG